MLTLCTITYDDQIIMHHQGMQLALKCCNKLDQLSWYGRRIPPLAVCTGLTLRAKEVSGLSQALTSLLQPY